MYLVIKEKGNNQNVFVENTEAHKSLNIGRLSMEIIKILEEEGYTFGTAEEDIVIKDNWSLAINSDTKDKLSRLAMRMNKPIRDQRKKPSEQKPNEVPDLFDLIFG